MRRRSLMVAGSDLRQEGYTIHSVIQGAFFAACRQGESKGTIMKTLVAWDDPAEAELLDLYLNTDGSTVAFVLESPSGTE